MKTNRKTPAQPIFTHEGGKASRTSPLFQLRRSVMACLLWEEAFYESGEDIAKRIASLVPQCRPEEVASVAIAARVVFKLRHVPLLLAREMVRHKEMRPYVEETLVNIIERADEMAEFLALYWKDGKDQPVPACVKRGLAEAFHKFDEYQFAKYNREAEVKLRDVMFLVHPKPANAEQAALFKRIADDELKSPETWENRLSRGENKKEVFISLLAENKLGAMALLRNLRGMTEAGVDQSVIRSSLTTMRAERVLPYRFIAAAKHAPQFEPELEAAMFKCLEGAEKLKGRSLLLVDVSGSMDGALSQKSDLSRIDAACGLGMLLREICEQIDIYTFSSNPVLVPSRRGFALRDAIIHSQPHSSTYLGAALKSLDYGSGYERVIVITDEQSADAIQQPKVKGYILNVAAYQNGIGYGPWTKIDGFSEACVRFIAEMEAEAME